MSMTTPLDNNKEIHGFLPGQGGQNLPDIVMSLLIAEQEV